LGHIASMAVITQTHSQLVGESIVSARQAAYAAANSAENKKAAGTIVMDVRKVTVLADFFVICGASSPAQVKGIVDNIEKTLAQLGYHAAAIEGKMEGRWVLLDFGQIIVHVLQERERSLYSLERFWNHALIVDRSSWLETIAHKSA
jgi:ribosome-associated protein